VFTRKNSQVVPIKAEKITEEFNHATKKTKHQL